jgi:membrane-associated phospholipid phosphatase
MPGEGKRSTASTGSVLISETSTSTSKKSAVPVLLIAYVSLAVVLLGIGYLLTHPLAHSVGAWDERVNNHFAAHRTVFWNDVTGFATAAFNTTPVVVAAAVVTGLLALRKHFREAVFLVLALIVEITVFLSVTFIVARPRPTVHRLNSTPATSSFPSGHTAAATVLFVGIAVIVTCCTSRRFLRIAAGLVALVIPCLVGFSRVYRGLHHPTDVFVGFLFGLACLTVSALAVRTVAAKTAAPAEVRADDTPSRPTPAVATIA